MRGIAIAPVIVCIGLGASLSEAAEAPDAKLNPVSNEIEIADPVWAGTNFDIRYVVNPGRNATTFDLATDPADDLRPRMTFAQNGDTWVAWWRDGAIPQVLVRTYDRAAETWSAEVALGDPSVPGRNPEIVHDGTHTWVGLQARVGQETVIKVGAIEDQPDPFGVYTEVAATTFEDDLNMRIHTKGGKLWVTWIDGLTEVGWCEYDYASRTWSLPGYVVYMAGNTKAAEEQIEVSVLGN